MQRTQPTLGGTLPRQVVLGWWESKLGKAGGASQGATSLCVLLPSVPTPRFPPWLPKSASLNDGPCAPQGCFWSHEITATEIKSRKLHLGRGGRTLPFTWEENSNNIWIIAWSYFHSHHSLCFSIKYLLKGRQYVVIGSVQYYIWEAIFCI